ncbi:MAG TPA: outer membrane protein transport protein [Burkholderiales bacterium]|nr:outer membrane protein transport protein [Burkholderiales bacterium]
MKLKNSIKLVVVAACWTPLLALATNGYFQHGYGVKAQGMAGVGIALPQDSLAAATNPAGMAFIGDRFDVGLVYFRPIRGADISGNNPFLPPGDYEGNQTNPFLIPDVGYNKLIIPRLSLGVSVFGNGGMNTDYDRPIPLFNGGATNTSGVDLSQLFIAPTAAYKVTDNHALGFSLIYAYQIFAAKGLEGFAPFSTDPNSLTNRGHQSSRGWGGRVGWTGRINDYVTLGATYQSKIWMSKLTNYSGLFADQGAFDIPANFGGGIAIKPAPTFTVGFDWQKILYSGVAAVSNPSVALLGQGRKLGSSGGPGFGWQDMTIYKLGASWEHTPLTFRAGFSYGKEPIRPEDALINILAPGVIEEHATIGLTWAVFKAGELSFSYMHGFGKNVTGPVPAAFGGGTVNLHMYQNSAGISFGWKM